MCGIAGCYQQDHGPELAAGMSTALAHRGPDALGAYEFADERVKVALAHRRLSIIDPDARADQPYTQDGLVLSYNGELYNYRDLRAQLAALGTRFRTSSDTEVVLESWRQWGPSALTRFRGMFAFAIFDERTGELALARDPLGVKPLFFMPRGDGVIFASELKAIATVVGRETTIDPAAVVASLIYGWVPEQRCALTGMRKVAPGSWVSFSPDGSMTEVWYWRAADVAAEAANAPRGDLRAVLEQSVSAHLVADVPVSTFLSGGLDSSIVTVLGKRDNPELDAYTIGVRGVDQRLEAMPDDLRYARVVAEQNRVELHEITIEPNVVDLLPRLVRALDEPIGDPAVINTFLICEAARARGVKVLLSGMGADELFGGYRRHLACLLAARYRRLPKTLRHGVVRPVVDRLPVASADRSFRSVRWAKRFLAFAELAEEPAFRRSYTLFGGDELADLLDPTLDGFVEELFEEHAAVYADTTLTDSVNRMCLADARLFLPSLNLAYTDRASMAASTEVRVPFVDVDVFRAAFSVPGSDKIARRTGKVALKSAAEAWLPDQIVHRPKANFGAPLRTWVRRDLRSEIDDVVLGGDLVTTGLLRRPTLEAMIREDRAGRRDLSRQIWQVLNLELWYQEMRSLGVGALSESAMSGDRPSRVNP